jgi:biopolymer transport protein ExbD
MNIPAPYPRRRARIEIIPLIDIIFFLLATFVVVSMSMVKNDGVSVNLPKAATSTAQDTQNTITLTVKENGDIYFNKTKMGTSQLENQLQQAKKTPNLAVIINGDDNADFGRAIQVLDIVRSLGITKVAIRTQK